MARNVHACKDTQTDREIVLYTERCLWSWLLFKTCAVAGEQIMERVQGKKTDGHRQQTRGMHVAQADRNAMECMHVSINIIVQESAVYS